MKKSEAMAVLRGRIRQLDSDIEDVRRQNVAAWAGNWKSFVHYAKMEREAIQMAITVLDEDGMKLIPLSEVICGDSTSCTNGDTCKRIMDQMGLCSFRCPLMAEVDDDVEYAGEWYDSCFLNAAVHK